MKKIVVFASGGGSSVENLYLYFSKKPNFEVLKLYCNNPEAGVLERNRINSLKKLLFSNDDLNSDKILNDLQNLSPDLIVLAGFLKKIPEKIVDLFKNKIVNIHPSLLPKYGGKGMFGINVHKAVIDNNEEYSGFTIHYVNIPRLGIKVNTNYFRLVLFFRGFLHWKDMLFQVLLTYHLHQPWHK